MKKTTDICLLSLNTNNEKASVLSLNLLDITAKFHSNHTQLSYENKDDIK
uniref:Uncharacterized protein n=1 Tax=Octopus bimaculoides TaxID=37653 RepID=A0A0L8GK27_OCTBM